MDQFDVMAKVYTEMKHQNDKWGEQNHTPMRWNSILMEEVGEVAKATLEDTGDNYFEELIHVAAVAIQSYLSVKRQGLF